MKWQIVDLLDFEGEIHAVRGGLLINETRVPLQDVGTVLLGGKCRWGYGLVSHAAKFDVAVLVCDWRMVPISVLLHWSNNTRVGARQRAQANLSVPKQKQAWKALVETKIRNQAQCLKFAQGLDVPRLRELARMVRSGDPSNCEAQAALVYWGQIYGGEFRRAQEMEDATNSFLNYGYTILRGVVVRSIVSHGLWPALGVFHRHRANEFALADDLVEPFRPCVDLLVHQLIQMGSTEVDKSVRRKLASVGQQRYGASGETVATAIDDLCSRYANYVEGDGVRFTVSRWSPDTNG